MTILLGQQAFLKKWVSRVDEISETIKRNEPILQMRTLRSRKKKELLATQRVDDAFGMGYRVFLPLPIKSSCSLSFHFLSG